MSWAPTASATAPKRHLHHSSHRIVQPAPDFGITLGLLDWYKTNMTIKAKSQDPALVETLGLGTSEDLGHPKWGVPI